jgi:hypothetical protein
MDFKFRLTEEYDYEELVSWWNFHRFPAPPLALLDNMRYGIMVSLNGEHICCGFIYLTNAKAFGLIEYIVSTYKVRDKTIRKEALIFLINTLSEFASRNGVMCLYTSLKNPSLVKHYQACGYITGSTNTIEMIKIL